MRHRRLICRKKKKVWFFSFFFACCQSSNCKIVSKGDCWREVQSSWNVLVPISPRYKANPYCLRWQSQESVSNQPLTIQMKTSTAFLKLDWLVDHLFSVLWHFRSPILQMLLKSKNPLRYGHFQADHLSTLVLCKLAHSWLYRLESRRGEWRRRDWGRDWGGRGRGRGRWWQGGGQDEIFD